MIFGTPEFFVDAITGKRFQVCLCDARFPDGRTERIHVFADKNNGYFLGTLSERYDLMMEDNGGTTGIGRDLTAILTLRNIIEVKDERLLS